MSVLSSVMMTVGCKMERRSAPGSHDAWRDYAAKAVHDQFGSDSANNYGTQANFQNNYQLSAGFIDALKAPFTTEDRIWISEGPLYGTQVADFNSLLTSRGVMHTLSTTETNDAHSWSGGWLSNAVAGLYGLEKNLSSSAGT